MEWVSSDSNEVNIEINWNYEITEKSFRVQTGMHCNNYRHNLCLKD